MRESFVFYKSTLDAVERIKSDEVKGKVYRAIIRYGILGEEPTESDDIETQLVFCQAKPYIDAANKRYDTCTANGKKGGRPHKQTQGKPAQNQAASQTPNLTDTETVTDTLTETKTETKTDTETETEPDAAYPKEAEFLKSLSQKYPNLEMNVEPKALKGMDLERVGRAIEESVYLQRASMLFVVKHYDTVIQNYYRTFKPQPEPQYANEHKYSKEFLNSLFDTLDDVDIGDEDLFNYM